MAHPTLASMRQTIYTTSEPQKDFKQSMKGSRRHRKENLHIMWNYDRARVDVELAGDPLNGGSKVKCKRNSFGRSIYLPYIQNKITSTRLEPPRGKIDFFYTANMSGCKFYVDAIQGSNDLIVYHANIMGRGGETPSWQGSDVKNRLEELHRLAQQDYYTPRHSLKTIKTLEKGDYLKGADPLVNIKKTRVRERKNPLKLAIRTRNVGFAGGTAIFGYPKGNAWRFYYQTWGRVYYERPSGKKNKTIAFLTLHWRYLNKLKNIGTKQYVGDNQVIASGEIDDK